MGLLSIVFDQCAEEGNVIVPRGTKSAPPTPQVFVRPNLYDPNRGHVVVINWSKSTEVEIPLGKLAKRGYRYGLYDPRHLFDPPALEGRIDGDTIRVPLSGDFAVWVLKVEETK